MKLGVAKRTTFIDPRRSGEEGLVAIGGELSVQRLLEAYSFGIFPWPHEGLPVLWFCPEPRGVLDFYDFHISRSLKKYMNRHHYKITFNKAFSEVVMGCAQMPRPGQQGTWITDYIVEAYVKFHEAGYAHSVECWMDGSLAGGIYGVYVGGVFSGESMFFRRDNASKICLVHLVDQLKQNGLDWMDIQMVTEHLKSVGGKYISRDEYLTRLEKQRLNAKPLVLTDFEKT